MGIKFCKELSNDELHEYNNNALCNTKITQNKDNEICYYKYPRMIKSNKRSVNIFYVEYALCDSLVKIVDYIYEYMYYNNLEQYNNVLVKIFIKWDEPIASSELLKKCDILSENISSYIQVPCVVINIFGKNELQSKVLFHIVEDEFNYRITRGIIITNNNDCFSQHISNKFKVINLDETYKTNSEQTLIQIPVNTNTLSPITERRQFKFMNDNEV